ncbi:MAG: trypsin-like serine protease, partial [Pirellulaceae bacterium]|nr:trypsin-like serine protease [Pirellulaceae bacterium]
MLLALLVLPKLAEQIQYSVSRGDQRAKAEVARQVLAQFPESATRLAYVAKSIAPSVVGIETAQLSAPLPTDERELLFGVPSLRTEGMGSGVIVDAEGYVVTNNHVIDQAAQITVKMSDGSKIRDIKVVGRDPLTDLALLKMEGGPFLPAPWGDSGTLEVGDPVLAVGNPFGLDRTVTAGIVSATGRRAQISPLAHQDFLQTDAAINPGNSGGPLVNMQGEVVGINTAIYGRQNLGISFAIPSQIAKKVCDG